MPTYKFEAMDTTGGEVKESIEASNEEEAQQKIRQRGYFVTRLTEVVSKTKDRAVARSQPTFEEGHFEELKDDLDAEAQNALGIKYADGNGVPNDDVPSCHLVSQSR